MLLLNEHVHAGMAGSEVAPPVTTPVQQPMNYLVQEALYPQLDFLAQKLLNERMQTTLAGYPAFNGKDKFLPGKIATGMAHILLNTTAATPAREQALKNFHDIADMTVALDNHSWGIYYYLLALHQIHEAGLLEHAVSPATLAKLKQQLDWRSFVNVSDLKLINLPTNYYGVAFGVARLRMLLGWESVASSEQLLSKLLTHYDAHSGQYGFSDETDGEGRFDRYSILLIAEICHRLIETGKEVRPDLKLKLRKAADIALAMSNTHGDGFSFGRSIGAYGDTAILEILSASAYLGVLTAEEKDYAYAYSTRIFNKFRSFWYDPQLHSVDLWSKGRKTDAYRGVHRVLGENFSLLHQLLTTNAIWVKMGYAQTIPKSDLQAWADKTQPRFRLDWFARGEYDRALATYRDRQHVFSLLLANGGPGQHANSPYYALPFSSELIAGIPDSGFAHPQLLPKLTLDDGTELIATAFIKNIQTTNDAEGQYLTYQQDGLTRMTAETKSPQKDTRVKLQSRYQFAPGSISRTDEYQQTGTARIRQVSLEFASFSDEASIDGNSISFSQGGITKFSVEGLEYCSVKKLVNDTYFQTPSGPFKSLITCTSKQLIPVTPLIIKWTMQYQ
ncbi:hypothetical protein [Undibacterium sp. TS12]|uniref:hypothetical protein n=1 Tax=Undibacterium sp. TS12 TaxID=2908202 RepID=UPI001F4CC02C|nr:hypothetical protein [Undibacterium sp. TS12]MCH8621996.1 hypothetical protein [Undibacterium sp. TS12]